MAVTKERVWNVLESGKWILSHALVDAKHKLNRRPSINNPDTKTNEFFLFWSSVLYQPNFVISINPSVLQSNAVLWKHK